MNRTTTGTKWTVRSTSIILMAVAVLFLMPESSRGDSLIEAAKRGDTPIVSEFLKAGTNPSTKDSDGKTALIWAAGRGHKNVLQLLLNQGADVNAADSDGVTALIIASAVGSTDIVSALLSGGANPNARSKAGLTPLYVAANKGHEEIVTLLLKNGADPNKKGYSEVSPLAAAVAFKHVRVVEILMDHGATDPNVIISEPKAVQKLPSRSITTPSEIKAYANDYLTVLLYLFNRGRPDLLKYVSPILEKHNLVSAKIVAGFSGEEEDKYELLLTSNGKTPVFKDTWVDPLAKLLSSRGDFPTMSFRNGSVFLNDQNNLVIDSGTELTLSGKTFRYSKDKEWEWIR